MGRHERTLQAVFEEPTRSDLKWSAVVAMLRSLGAEITEGRGSRVRVYLEGVRAVFHRPHPQKEMIRAAVRSLQRFLREAGRSP